MSLALEFVRATELAAIHAARWIGKGEAKSADKAAVDAMREALNQIDFTGEVVIGEGDKDASFELHVGEILGKGRGDHFDIAVDPLECTASVAYGRPNAITTIVTAPRGKIICGIDTYMQKIAVGPEAASAIDIDAGVLENISSVARALGKDIEEITVAVLDRPRHEKLISEVRATGARVQLFTDGDIAMAIATCLKESPIDIMMGVGGSTEAVIAAAALKFFGGQMFSRWQPKEEHKPKLANCGITDLNQVLSVHDLIKGDEFNFAATGVITGPLLSGVVFKSDEIITHSLVIASRERTARFIESRHRSRPPKSKDQKLEANSMDNQKTKIENLYVLPFDHRGSFIKMFGFREGKLTPEEVGILKDYKHVVYEGFLKALESGAPKDKAALLVDEEFGAEIHREARALHIKRILTIEKSGQEEFAFEYGDKFGEHIEKLAPRYVKVLVRYNPESDKEMNKRQIAELKKLDDFCKTKGYRFLFELLVEPTAEQLARCGGKKDEYEKKLQGALTVQAIAELQEGGIEPDVWKLEGIEVYEDIKKVVEKTRSGGRDNVGVVVLGRGESEEKVRKWLTTAANIPGVIGFAVGRTVFKEPLKRLHDGEASREEAIAAIAGNYKKFVDLFEGERSSS